MAKLDIFQSVVMRLVACLILGGVVLSVGLSVLEFRRSHALIQMQVTQQAALSMRSLQSLVRGAWNTQPDQELQTALSLFIADPRFRSVRISSEGRKPIQVGDWSTGIENTAQVWTLTPSGISLGNEVRLDQPTLVRSPILIQGKLLTIELLVDGPEAQRELQARIFSDMSMQWLLLSVMTLLGLLLIRRWFTGPLSDVVSLIGANAGPSAFYDLSSRRQGEFSKLAEAIAGMLTRLDCTAQRLRQREQAFEDLYHFAPAAMISLDPTGIVVEANRRAAQLLGVAHDKDLLGKQALDYVPPEDRALLRQTIDRLSLDQATRCELRVLRGSSVIDVLVECTGVRDEEGVLRSVRLSLLDVSQSKQLQRQLADKGRLLNLIIDHMSDGILLVDDQGRIAAHNQALETLLRRRSNQIIGQPYDRERFWDELGVVNHDLFVQRLRQIDADHDRPAQERFETRTGTFLFEGIPIQDTTGESVGRLWVIRETTALEQSQRLLTQQSSQLQALRQMNQKLSDVTSVDDLLVRAGQSLYQVLDVEAVGLALRSSRGDSRCLQIIHRGQAPMLLGSHTAMVQSIAKSLMPHVLSKQEVMFWPDLSVSQPWSKSFQQAGLTSLAAGPLPGSADPLGVLWIARHGGERMERRHIHLMEALIPVLAARLEFAIQRQRMQDLKYTDPITDLANAAAFDQEIRKLANRPGHHWSVAVLRMDHFRKLNQVLEHDVADQLLRQVAGELQRVVRKSNPVARLDGPSFGILCPSVDQTAALAMGQRLQQAIAALPVKMPDGTKVTLTMSIGLATSPVDGTHSQQLLDLAQARSRKAKASGGNQVVASGSPSHRQAG